MIVENDMVVCFDVDDTLVMWDIPEHTPEDALLSIGGYQVLPHLKHIEQLKKHRARGHVIIVWSAGGFSWASTVVKALQLEEYVDLVLCKPQWFYDDLPASEFMPEINRVYYPVVSQKEADLQTIKKAIEEVCP